MKAKSSLLENATFWCTVLAAIAIPSSQAQTLINLGTQGRNIDFSNAPSTRPEKTGSSLPAYCQPGQLFFNLAAVAGQNLYACVANNTWSVVGAGSVSGLSDPGSNGLIVRTALNTTSAVAAPSGTVVGTTDTQTLTNKSISASEVNSGTLSSSQMPALTGDVSSSAGSTATTLASVNSNPGSYGDSSHSVQLTVDGKGRITGISQAAISGGSSTQNYQTIDQTGNPLIQRPALDLSSAFGVSDNAASNRTEIDLATVNSNPGSYGDSSHSVQLTVDGKGRITGVSQAAISVGSSTQNYQTIDQAGAPLTQRPALDLSSAFGVSDNATSNRTEIDLATVNSSPGSYGDSSHSVQLTVDAKGRVTGISQVAVSGGSSTQNYQTIDQAGAPQTQRPALDLSSAFSVSDNASSSRTEIDLATVNSNPGTFGSTSQVPVITVNNHGQITAVSTVAANASPASTITSGSLVSMQATCSPGGMYFATDQPAGQQLYTCSSANTWTQIGSVGASGALAYSNGSLDIVTSVVPRLTAANNFTGMNSFTSGMQLTTTSAGQPVCGSSTRGLFWFQNNGASKDGLQVCVYSGTAFIWTNLY